MGVLQLHMQIHAHTDTRTDGQAGRHTSIHTSIHPYIHTYIHACMHACMHTHTEAFSQIPIDPYKPHARTPQDSQNGVLRSCEGWSPSILHASCRVGCRVSRASCTRCSKGLGRLFPKLASLGPVCYKTTGFLVRSFEASEAFQICTAGPCASQCPSFTLPSCACRLFEKHQDSTKPKWPKRNFWSRPKRKPEGHPNALRNSLHTRLRTTLYKA